MRRDSPLAPKETVSPEDLWDKPLIISHQRNNSQYLADWFKRTWLLYMWSPPIIWFLTRPCWWTRDWDMR